MKFVAISPYSGIWPHAMMETLAAINLKPEDEVEFLRCDGIFKTGCTTMSAFGIDYSADQKLKESACKVCRTNRDMLGKSFKFKSRLIESLVSDEKIKNIKSIVKNLSQDSVLDFQYNGHPVAIWSLYEFLIDKKKNSLNFSEREIDTIRSIVENACFAIEAAEAYFEREKPDRVIAYNGFYVAHRCFVEIAKLKNIKAINLHGGSNLAHDQNSIFTSENHNINYIKGAIAKWPNVKDRPISKENLERVFEHCQVLLKGKSVFVYSKGTGTEVNFHQKLNLPESGQIVTASLSSYDERFGAEVVGILDRPKDAVFKDQVEWVKALLEWAKSKPEVTLIIRPHPRELPNKRESATATHAMELKSLLTDIPPNVRVNWPEDNISIYDLALFTDVFLCAWSSVALEAALFGTPCVLYSKDLPLYPAEICYIGKTTTDYFECIDKALKQNFSVERIKAVYRWWNLFQNVGVVDLAPQSQMKAHYQYSFIEKVVGKLDAVLGTKTLKRRDIWYAKNKKIANSEITLLRDLFLNPNLSDSGLEKRYPHISDNEETLALKNVVQKMLELLNAKTPYRRQLKRIQLLTEFCNSVTVKS